MLRQMLLAKIQRATVTAADLNYEGSITIDKSLLDASGILVYERVQVLNINSGKRAETYVIKGKRGNGDIIMNGAIARLAQVGDPI
ncbi:aspartate 1-decarboxylase, partial [bacterium]|nr:aspartate 1-decarboxylase [bacterium]